MAVATGAAIGTLTVVFGGSPAAAHVEVVADNPQAGAGNVTVTFTGEGESTRAGIVSERVVLPTGIAPADVRLVSAPPGWTLTVAADGYTVAGPALKPKDDAVHSVMVARLPVDATVLVFKTIETYSDGKVSRWIDVPDAANPEPENPAPALKLRPAAPGAAATSVPTSSSAPASPSPATSPTESSNAAAPASSDSSDNTPVGWIAAIGGIVVVGALGIALLARRRRSDDGTNT
ncbi:DUF1775 domain-containing protein [Dactylosporangium sucinum]|uniref:YncI copper-binding domain-containing protein n=1 Tax=Dactylosporangium sucinum TaxID=1424081 RepID=A0A917X4X3_9ACTN|nr:DUF1775 domain-containing protein [Dactylosporangium sucinum]GGM67280.1 hypothetical protein GCM10007977_081240 [Dactylosporangium sucinum]